MSLPDEKPYAPPGMPRWVKTFLLVALALVLLFVVMHLTGGFRGHALP